MDSGHRHR
ncbi:hypothetical protein D018_3115A, partial [Vibrio parahaemolyticus VP2007-007]